jgi:Acyl-CoA synthetase (NDP forming)
MTSLSPPKPAPGAGGIRDLTALFTPRSVAVVGASDDTSKYGNWIAVHALRGDRPVHLVNRSRSSVLGRPAAPSLRHIGEPVDLAVITVPAAGFEAAVDDALAVGVRAIVGISGGLGEAGEEGRRRQDRIAARVRAAGACLLGPNCLGVLDHTSGLDLTSNDFRRGRSRCCPRAATSRSSSPRWWWTTGWGSPASSAWATRPTSTSPT